MTTRLAIGAAVAALLAAAVTATAPTSAVAQDPVLGAPVVGQCFDLDAEELSQPSHPETAIDCSAPHTSRVVGVAIVPDGLGLQGPKVERFALETCYAAARTAIGVRNMRALNLTAFRIGWFVPTDEQQAAGARWLRCDLVLGGPSDLQPLPAQLEVGRFPYATGVSRCLAGRDLHDTACSSRHTYRATAAVTVPGKRYPRAEAWQELGNTRCVPGVITRVFRFGWPTKASWKAGDHTLTCYSRTRR
ncbi:hypothetical protein EUA93_09150 [Nocardioides oleivorans]|uniref:Septum formation-related domain-containing protein n=1 Tax=Nocardioides oleivorans TaxID=273676 RepID=A0A4Q2S278_9ACTN|nr:septum formation family protein [Nocardioides oleivorans]RYB94495.1 hypothetical protein EUA93_09150 [Nocardioides oleivorans]